MHCSGKNFERLGEVKQTAAFVFKEKKVLDREARHAGRPTCGAGGPDGAGLPRAVPGRADLPGLPGLRPSLADLPGLLCAVGLRGPGQGAVAI